MRSTDYNRFQEKMRKGTEQLFFWGWNARLSGSGELPVSVLRTAGKVKFSGENAANYPNPSSTACSSACKSWRTGRSARRVVSEMVEILQRDAPWVYGFYPKDFRLAHQWVYNRKPNKMANNTLKYQRIDPALRERMRDEWNQPVVWPLALLVLVLVLLLLPAVRCTGSANGPVPCCRRQRETADDAAAMIQLSDPPGALCDADPDRREPAHLCCCSSSSTPRTTWPACSSGRSG